MLDGRPARIFKIQFSCVSFELAWCVEDLWWKGTAPLGLLGLVHLIDYVDAVNASICIFMMDASAFSVFLMVQYSCLLSQQFVIVAVRCFPTLFPAVL